MDEKTVFVNDPAGSKKVQYECFREEGVTPTKTTRQYLTSLEVRFKGDARRGRTRNGNGQLRGVGT